MVSYMFNQTWLFRYPHPREFVFENGSNFKQYFTPLIKYFTITPICTSINNPQSNALVEHIHQVFNNMIVTKNIDINVYDYMYPWGLILSSVVWSIRPHYHQALRFAPGCSKNSYLSLNLGIEPRALALH